MSEPTRNVVEPTTLLPTPPTQPPYDELIESLRRDWDIEASWDGLRRFWYVGLTDEGVRKRDEREATLELGTCHNAAPSYLDFLCSECGFVHYHSDENDSGDGNEWHYCPNCGRELDRLRELGIEVGTSCDPC